MTSSSKPKKRSVAFPIIVVALATFAVVGLARYSADRFTPHKVNGTTAAIIAQAKVAADDSWHLIYPPKGRTVAESNGVAVNLIGASDSASTSATGTSDQFAIAYDHCTGQPHRYRLVADTLESRRAFAREPAPTNYAGTSEVHSCNGSPHHYSPFAD